MPVSVPAVVRSAECQRVIRLLMVSLAEHERSEVTLAAEARALGRLRVLASEVEFSRIRRESVLVRSVSLAEAFTYDQLRVRLERHAPSPRTALVEKLYLDEEKKATGSWDAAKEAFKKWGPKVELAKFPRWDELRAVIEARNAVVHGLGHFTPLQRRSGSVRETKARLRSLSFVIDTPDHLLQTTPQALTEASKLLREYLEFLDNALFVNP